MNNCYDISSFTVPVRVNFCCRTRGNIGSQVVCAAVTSRMPVTRKLQHAEGYYAKLADEGFAGVMSKEDMSKEENVLPVEKSVLIGEEVEKPDGRGDGPEQVELGDPEADERAMDETLVRYKEETELLERDIRIQAKRKEMEETLTYNSRLRDHLNKLTDVNSEAEAGTQGFPESVDKAHAATERTQSVDSSRFGAQSSSRKPGSAKPPVPKKPIAVKNNDKSVSKKPINVSTFKQSESLHTSAEQALHRLGLLGNIGPGATPDSSESDIDAQHVKHVKPRRASKFDDAKATERVMRSGKLDPEYCNSYSNILQGGDMQRDSVKKVKSRRKKGSLKSQVYFQNTSNSDSSELEGEQQSDLKWPHENLGAKYNNFGKNEVKYKNLDLRLLTAGEINICGMYGVSQNEKDARLRLLGDVVFNAAFYQWNAILKFHAAVLGEIQQGNMQWGDDYYRLEQQMLMPFPLVKGKSEKRGDTRDTRDTRDTSGRGRDSARSGSGGNYSQPVYCADYQKGSCLQGESHQGWFFGSKVMLHHVCSNCLKNSNIKANHPASNTECPNYER